MVSSKRVPTPEDPAYVHEIEIQDSIELLPVELYYYQEYRPLSGARVRYVRDGVEQENGFPIDLHKGAFVATVPIQETGLEEELQKIGPEIARIVYEDLAESRRTSGMTSFADQG